MIKITDHPKKKQKRKKNIKISQPPVPGAVGLNHMIPWDLFQLYRAVIPQDVDRWRLILLV